MDACHKSYIKEMAGHMKALADFMVDPGDGDGVEEEKPAKAIDMDKVSEYLRKSAENK
jgi:hypothetical protein